LGFELSSHPQDLASSFQEYLTLVHVAERDRDELQQQCDFINKEIVVKQEELEELRDQLEETIWDSQKKKAEIMLLDKTLQQNQKHLLDIDTKLLQRQSELADLHYVFELEESNLSQLLNEKDGLCLPVNELVASLRKELQSVEKDIESQETKLANVKQMESEIRELTTATVHKLDEYEGVERQLETVSAELSKQRSKLNKVMDKIQMRKQEVDILSRRSTHMAREQSNAVSFLGEILKSWRGQTMSSMSSTTGTIKLSEMLATQLAELMKVAKLKHNEIMHLNQSITEKLSEISAIDVARQGKQRELDELQSTFEVQYTACQQMKDEFMQERIKEETKLMEIKQELDKLSASTVAGHKRLKEVELQVASAEQLKMATERELNKGLFALTSVRQELEEVSQMKPEVTELSDDYEKLQKQRLALQNQLDRAIEEKKQIQHRYQKLYECAKCEITNLKSELRDLKSFMSKHSSEQV
jgi:chromosome segregation ATPase